MTRSILLGAALVSLLTLGACNGDDAESNGEGAATGDGGAAVVPGPAGAAGESSATSQREFAVGDASFIIPEPWQPEPPSNAMRAAQFRIMPPEGVDADPAVGAVFTSIGGSIDDNVTRWEAQFADPTDRDTSKAISTINGRTLAVFTGRGTFDEGRAMGSTGPREDWMVLGFIAELNSDRPLVVKIEGPAATLEPQLATWERMVDSIELGG